MKIIQICNFNIRQKNNIIIKGKELIFEAFSWV